MALGTSIRRDLLLLCKRPHAVRLRTFYTISATVLVLGILFAWWSFSERFQVNALEWMGFFLAVAILCQQITGLRGVTYLFYSSEAKRKYDVQSYDVYSKPSSHGRFKTAVRAIHWVALGFLAIMFVLLIKETFWPADISNEQVVSQITKAQQDQNQAIIDRLDRLISLMEAQNVSDNATVSTK